jgi:Cell cycle regulated microtubule associated protein
LNTKLFKSVLGVPKLEKLPSTTEFSEFNLRLNQKRLTESQQPKLTSEELAAIECQKQFKARQLNKKILQAKPSTSIERKSAPPQLGPGMFKEFKFKSEERIEQHKKKREVLEEQKENFVFKAKPVPKYPEGPASPGRKSLASS